MTRRNRAKRQISTSPVTPEETVAALRTPKAKQQKVSEDNVNEISDAESTTDSDDCAHELSLLDLHKMIKQDIRRANQETKAQIDGLANQINESIIGLKDEIEGIKSSQQFISSEFETIKTTLADHKTTLASLTRDVTSIKAVHNDTQHHMEELNFELNALKQANLEGHLLISNVIKAADEDLGEIFSSIVALLNIVCSPEDILGITRMASSNQKGIQPMLVRFSNIALKEKVMRAARDRPITCSEIGLGINQRIYFNNRLTSANQRLLGAARRFKKEHNFRFVWFANGTVFLRKDESSKAIRISDVRDLSAPN